MKKYNSSTGCYKIDIFINGCYVCSTDWAKTCKEAKANYIKQYPLKEGEKITAYYFKY